MSRTRVEITKLAAANVPISEIAVALDLAPATVRYHLQRLSEPPAPEEATEVRPAPARIDGATRSRVRELLDEGLTRSEIAARLGVSKAAVTYHARRLGEQIDERCARRYDWPAVQRFYDAGNSMRRCAEQFGFSPASWSQAVRAAPSLRARPRCRSRTCASRAGCAAGST